MDFNEQLRLLQEAQGNPAKLALAAVDLAFPSFSLEELTALKEALLAAAIPHWCDEYILAALLEIPLAESTARLVRLRGLNLTEPFPARGLSAINIHESARLALRREVARNHAGGFQVFSARAVAFFSSDFTPVGRIEWLYHLFSADPDRGAAECEALDRKWGVEAHPEDRYALAEALNELETSGMLSGRARVEVLLCVGDVRFTRGDATKIIALAREARALAVQVGHSSGEARASSLLGDSFRALGNLPEAEKAFAEFWRISRQLAAQEPSNAAWQGDLAVANSRVGEVLEERGKLPEAQEALTESLRIIRQLAAQDPSNAGWQRELMVANGRVGELLQAQGKLPETQEAFAESLRINRQLAAQDSNNAGWQRDLAVANTRVGDVLQAQGKLSEAQEAFMEGLRISRQLAEHDPSNARLQRGLGVANHRVGYVLQSQGKLPQAQEAFMEYLRISRLLAEKDPTNVHWLREVAVAFWCVAEIEAASDQMSAAVRHYEEAQQILSNLVKVAPEFAGWAMELQRVEQELASIRRRSELGSLDA